MFTVYFVLACDVMDCAPGYQCKVDEQTGVASCIPMGKFCYIWSMYNTIPKTWLHQGLNFESRIRVLRLDLHFLQSPTIQSTQCHQDLLVFIGKIRDSSLNPRLYKALDSHDHNYNCKVYCIRSCSQVLQCYYSSFLIINLSNCKIMSTYFKN